VLESFPGTIWLIGGGMPNFLLEFTGIGTGHYTSGMSANSIGIVFDGTAIGNSLMYNKKRSGPNTEPCGTP
jgi:hypothetical protein